MKILASGDFLIGTGAGLVVQVKESFQHCSRTLLNLMEFQAHPKTICRRGEALEVLNEYGPQMCVRGSVTSILTSGEVILVGSSMNEVYYAKLGCLDKGKMLASGHYSVVNDIAFPNGFSQVCSLPCWKLEFETFTSSGLIPVPGLCFLQFRGHSHLEFQHDERNCAHQRGEHDVQCNRLHAGRALNYFRWKSRLSSLAAIKVKTYVDSRLEWFSYPDLHATDRDSALGHLPRPSPRSDDPGRLFRQSLLGFRRGGRSGPPLESLPPATNTNWDYEGAAWAHHWPAHAERRPWSGILVQWWLHCYLVSQEIPSQGRGHDGYALPWPCLAS